MLTVLSKIKKYSVFRQFIWRLAFPTRDGLSLLHATLNSEEKVIISFWCSAVQFSHIKTPSFWVFYFIFCLLHANSPGGFINSRHLYISFHFHLQITPSNLFCVRHYLNRIVMNNHGVWARNYPHTWHSNFYRSCRITYSLEWSLCLTQISLKINNVIFVIRITDF